MPNHVQTLLTITGDDATIDALLAKHVVARNDNKGQRFALDTIIPMPQVVIDTTTRPCFPDEEAKVPVEQRKYGGDGTVQMRAEAMLAKGRRFLRHPYTYQWIPETVRTWAELAAWLDEKYPGAKFWARRSLLCAAETGCPGWHEWSVENWGTKWDAYSYAPRAREPGRASLRFQTAWEVPRPCLRRLSEMYPSLTFAIESIDDGGPEYVGAFANGVETFEKADKDDARYERVYGRKRPRFDHDGEEIEEETSTAGAAS